MLQNDRPKLIQGFILGLATSYALQDEMNPALLRIRTGARHLRCRMTDRSRSRDSSSA
jgi:hypothetical protein